MRFIKKKRWMPSCETMLRPLGDRVLIKPVANPTETESGLHLVEHAKPDVQGEVVAVGTCAHPLKDVAEDLAARLDIYTKYLTDPDESLPAVRDAATLLRDLVASQPSVKPGDFVIFSWQDGQELYLDDERYLLMRESEIKAVLEPEGA